jgi:hypothetical protein
VLLPCLLVPYLLITKDMMLKTSVSSTSNAAKSGFMPAKKTKKTNTAAAITKREANLSLIV